MGMLNQELEIKNVRIHNRLVMAPIATSLARNGTVTDALLDYYSSRSEGGCLGLVITEHCYVRADGKYDPGQISVSRDEDVEGLKQLVDATHRNGSRIFAQINHAGFSGNSVVAGTRPLCVSKQGYRRFTGQSPDAFHEITADEIPGIVQAYADAAGRAKAAGFDGVEIHSAHGFLLNQFYSPLSNLRDDEYGGPLENRIRIHLEIIDAIKPLADDDFILALRLGASDYLQGGSSREDGANAASAFENAGLELIDISGGFCGFTRRGHREPGYFGELTEAVKERVSIPVILTGGVRTAEDAEALLQAGKADLIGVGRELMRDSGWARRNMEGHE